MCHNIVPGLRAYNFSLFPPIVVKRDISSRISLALSHNLSIYNRRFFDKHFIPFLIQINPCLSS